MQKHEAEEQLASDFREPCAGKLASTVLRGEGYSNVSFLPAMVEQSPYKRLVTGSNPVYDPTAFLTCMK